ncbi:pyridoxal phosphate-dependent aminotransferase [Homoserinibacter sp. GY 40078]|uniref:pyridoxal phosphate-dependent aminotransferase n=1 Tax=Homoserinibacter sp. GY 40078 TaxID=2603275 RepID=UPI0016504265|nr:aminotransferase class I/II-fold pyridoxal phosphate-dependent enzyme [Homoserinibacter sp. GY 40078]
MPSPAAVTTTLPHSGIREIVDLALSLDTPLVRLEIGEPDFPTPANIVEAAAAAGRRGASYVQASGIPPLRGALAEALGRRYDLDVPSSRVLVSHGAVHALDSVLRAVVAPGDAVMIPDPAWPNYEMQARLLGAEVVHYPMPAERGYLPDADEIRALVTPRTRAIVLNSPSNPTGALLPRHLVEEILRIAVEHDILVVSDEVYDEIVFDGAPVCAASIAPDHAVSVFSFSKTYAMTGWRVGYALVPEWLADPLTRVLESSISCLSSVNQAAALEAITGDQSAVARMREAYRARRDLAVGMLTEAGFDLVTPRGAFYLMVPLADGADSRAAALDLVTRGLSTAPGSAFGQGAPHALRLSLAASEESIRTGVGTLIAWHRETAGGLALEAETVRR